ncbi:MAG: DUF2283 domain-containing protein [Rhodospirillales bacterium]|jgi:uncharacterized protein YuzE|nr:DUF2283 domain-containing protein [Rhodospirillales bacterium]
MRVRFDQQSDALYIRLDESEIVESEEVSPGIVLDFDADNRVVGVEMLDVTKRLPAAHLTHMDFKVA